LKKIVVRTNILCELCVVAAVVFVILSFFGVGLCQGVTPRMKNPS